MRAEIDALRTAPGKLYDLDTYNCIHFVGRIAQLAGLKVDYPKNLLRKPRSWLNRVGNLNPKLGAKPIGG
jgi:exonuclease I